MILFLVFSFFLNVNISAQQSDNSKSPDIILSTEFSTWFVTGFATINFDGLIHRSVSGSFSLYGRLGLVKGFIHPIFCSKDKFTGKIIGLSLVNGIDNNQFDVNLGVYLISESELESGNSFFWLLSKRKKYTPTSRLRV